MPFDRVISDIVGMKQTVDLIYAVPRLFVPFLHVCICVLVMVSSSTSAVYINCHAAAAQADADTIFFF